jgi:lantibiotic modifying enzyme
MKKSELNHKGEDSEIEKILDDIDRLSNGDRTRLLALLEPRISSRGSERSKELKVALEKLPTEYLGEIIEAIGEHIADRRY